MEDKKENEKASDPVVDSDKTFEEEKEEDHKTRLGWIIFFAILLVLIAISIIVIEFVK